MKTILVVDDDNLNLATAREVLGGEYKVILVKKGQQALSYLKTGDCDVILLDINMPEMDGFEVMQKIREMDNCRNTPVIFLTGDTDSETESRCFKEGAMDFITKPFVPAVMLSRIGRILEIEDLRRSLSDRLEQKIREISDIKNKSAQDVLTGLWNREYTEEAVNGMLQGGVTGALMMIDMDNFKLINDNFGHIAGDNVLKMFADTMREFASSEDILCRIGGDEFVMFVRGVTSKQELSGRASDIINDICKKIKELKYNTDTSVSIGIAKAPEDGTEFSKLYNAADKALYFVKQNGKNSYHFFSDKLVNDEGKAEKTVDLRYLKDLMNRADNGKGAYLMDFDNFRHVYNFIRRFVERSRRDVQTLLFTLSDIESAKLDASEMEFAMESLERSIYTSLRRSDISTRYSSRQIIVILMDANSVNSDMVAERIIGNFTRTYSGKRVFIDYGIARLDGVESD